MFLKEKFSPDGTFDKLKARLVAGGHLQDTEIYNNGSSSHSQLAAYLYYLQ